MEKTTNEARQYTESASKSVITKSYIEKNGLKVTVHIPVYVPNKQEKINRIYDILTGEYKRK